MASNSKSSSKSTRLRTLSLALVAVGVSVISAVTLTAIIFGASDSVQTDIEQPDLLAAPTSQGSASADVASEIFAIEATSLPDGQHPLALRLVGNSPNSDSELAIPRFAHSSISAVPPSAIWLAGGRTWVPWPQFESQSYQPSYEQLSGVSPPWEEFLLLGGEYFQAVEHLWREAMPPYTEAALRRLSAGEPLSQRATNSQGTTWEPVVDVTGLGRQVHLSDDRRSVWEQIRLCPPHPASDAARQLATYQFSNSATRTNSAGQSQLAGGAHELAKRALELAQQLPPPDPASGEYQQLVAGMKSPTGVIVPGWGGTQSKHAQLLIYSPGEPMDIASGGHSLVDSGFFPGDWSAPALELLVTQAAAAAIADTNIWHAVQTRGPQSLWEACQDLVALSVGDNTNSERLAGIEALWARGVRLSFTSPPTQRAYVVAVSATGQSQVVICHPADEVFLTDAASSEKLQRLERRPERAEIMQLRWVHDRYRVEDSATFNGPCSMAAEPLRASDQTAFEKAVAWGSSSATAADAERSISHPHQWGSGLRATWIPVGEWVEIPDSQAWEYHRDPNWIRRLVCESGIPFGLIVDGELSQPGEYETCTAEQRATMHRAAIEAGEPTPNLSATIWQPTDSWFQRMFLSPFKSIEAALGCAVPDLPLDLPTAFPLSLPISQAESFSPQAQELESNAFEVIAATRVKRPWPSRSSNNQYALPQSPCQGSRTPPATDRFWWPPLGEKTSTVAGEPE